MHNVLHSYCCHSKVLNNDKIRNSMPGHVATLRRRIYVCKLYHTDPRRLLLLKQILRRLRIPIFSAQFILFLLELMFQLCSLLCLSFQTAHENNFTDFLSSVNCPKEHLLPSLSHILLHILLQRHAAVLLWPRNRHVKLLQSTGRKSSLLTAWYHRALTLHLSIAKY